MLGLGFLQLAAKEKMKKFGSGGVEERAERAVSRSPGHRDIAVIFFV